MNVDEQQSKEYQLRLMAADDLRLVLAWRNHPEIRRHMISQHEISIEEHRKWFDRISKNPNCRVLIFECDHSPIGFVSLTGVSEDGSADWGFYVAPDAPKGTGLKLGTAALKYAFVTARLHKVCGQAFDFNEASIRFHRKLGFQQEGVLREQYIVDGRYRDLICFGLLHQEWVSTLSG